MILPIGCDKNSSAEKANNTQDRDVKNSTKSNDKDSSKSTKDIPAVRLESHIDNLIAMAEPHIKTGNYRRYANDLLNYTEDNAADFIQIFADIFIYTVNEKGPVSRTEKFSEIAHSIFDVLESKQGFMKTIEENERFFSRTSKEISNRYGEWLSDFLDIEGLEILGQELGKRAQNISRNRDFNDTKSSNFASDIDICRCLIEPGNSSYMKANKIACRNAISNAIGVPNWERVNMSQNPTVSKRFDKLASDCGY